MRRRHVEHTHTHQSGLPSRAAGEDSKPKEGGKHGPGSFQKASSAITDLQGPFQGTHGRSSRGTAAGLKALPRLVKKRGQARRHVFPRAAPLQPAQRRVPRGGGQGRAGRRQDISLSLYLDYLKFLKNKRKKRERRGNEEGHELIHRELTSHSGQNQSPSGSDVSLRHLA